MKNFFKQFQTSNAKGVFSLLVGNSFAKGVFAVGGIILAGFYGADSYGVYNVYLSYVLILATLVTLRLENILILIKDNSEIKNLFSFILLVSTILIFILSLFFVFYKIVFNKDSDFSLFFLALCALGGLLTSWNNAQSALLVKSKLFRKMSKGLMIGAGATVLFQFVFFFLNQKFYGLMYGSAIGLVIVFCYYILILNDSLQKINFKKVKKSIAQNIEIIKYTYTSDLVNTVANNILPVLILIYFTKEEVGVYSMANKILLTPLMLLSASISKVYFQKSTELYESDNKTLFELTKRITLYSGALMILFVLIINTIGIYILNYFLDESWSKLGIFMLILSFWILTRAIVNPIMNVILVVKKNYYTLVFNVYLLFVNFIAIYIGGINESITHCVVAFSVLAGLGYLVLFLATMNHLKKISRQ